MTYKQLFDRAKRCRNFTQSASLCKCDQNCNAPFECASCDFYQSRPARKPTLVTERLNG